jgi:hypothetical protein
LLIRLIENDAAFSDYSVLGFVNGDLVSLKSVGADANVNVSFVNNDARVFRTGAALLRRFDSDLIGATPCTPPCGSGGAALVDLY